jgi:putative DNA primase/helicase
MTANVLEAALAYAERLGRVFPAQDKNAPLVKWRDAATTDPGIITAWWRRWPKAMVGYPTGIKHTVLDVDVKDPAAYGFDSLDELGFAILPDVPIAHTPSGGVHLYFETPDPPIRNTNSNKGRGIGPGLDWRGLGGYVILPSAESGYWWDPHLGIDAPLAEVPPELLPREPVQTKPGRPVQPESGLSRYAEAALDRACRAILGAPRGEQEATLNGECFAIGTLAAAGGVPSGFARDALRWAASQLPSYDPRRPWGANELAAKVDCAFNAGLLHPRGARHA